jgi:hypothetical protein
MADLTREVTLTLDEGDVCDMLTQELCRYGPMDTLRVAYVNKDDDGSFSLVLEPKPKRESPNG